MQLFKSKFTPNATGDEVAFNIGEIVHYNRKGQIIVVQIDSDRMSHIQCENLGYEAIWIKEDRRIFIDGKKIVWWEGKVNSEEQLDLLLGSTPPFNQ